MTLRKLFSGERRSEYTTVCCCCVPKTVGAPILAAARVGSPKGEVKCGSDATHFRHCMKQLLLLVILFSAAPTAFANCYVLKNDTSSPQTFQLKFNRTFPGMKPTITLAPHARYPTKGSWCLTRPADYY